ncbi:MAG: hypothetical protein ACM3P1_12955 [Candidatus Saccharibacteria bacterium]
MGIFNFFRPKQSSPGALPQQEPAAGPLHSYGQDKDPANTGISSPDNGQLTGIEAVYVFLQADYETRGYSDALINADNSNKEDGIKLIRLDLQLLTRRVNNYYEKKIKDYEVQISSRSRAGLMDLVEELRSEKEKAQRDIEELRQIAAENETGSGMVERMILSYQKGFMRGLSAITQSRMTRP